MHHIIAMRVGRKMAEFGVRSSLFVVCSCLSVCNTVKRGRRRGLAVTPAVITPPGLPIAVSSSVVIPVRPFPLAAPLVYGDGSPAGRALRLFYVLSSATPLLRAEIGLYLEEVNAERIDQLLAPLPPASVAVQKALFAIPDIDCRPAIAADLAFLCSLAGLLPENASIAKGTVASRAEYVQKVWQREVSGTGARWTPAARYVNYAPNVRELAAFYCKVQPGCVSIGSVWSDVTGARLLAAMVALRVTDAVESKASAAFNRSLFGRTRDFLTGTGPEAVFDGSKPVGGFRLMRLAGTDAAEQAAQFGCPAIANADAVLLSLGTPLQPGTAPSPDVHIFMCTASCEVVAVVERGGRCTSIIRLLTIGAMMLYSSDAALNAAFDSFIVQARREERQAAVAAEAATEAAAAAASDGFDDGDFDGSSDDGDVPEGDSEGDESPTSRDETGDPDELDLAARHTATRAECAYAAAKAAPRSRAFTFGSYGHLLHFLLTYRKYTSCAHVTEDFNTEWFAREPIFVNRETMQSASTALGYPLSNHGGLVGLWMHAKADDGCRHGCACSCHQKQPVLAAAASGSAPTGAPASATAPASAAAASAAPPPSAHADGAAPADPAAVAAAAALQASHNKAYEAAELPKALCPACAGAAFPRGIVFEHTGSGRRFASKGHKPPPPAPRHSSNPWGLPAAQTVPATLPESEVPPRLQTPLDARARLDAAVAEGCDIAHDASWTRQRDVACPDCPDKLLDPRSFAPCGPLKKLCFGCARLSTEASKVRAGETPASAALPADIAALRKETERTDAVVAKLLEEPLPDPSSCTDVHALRAEIARLSVLHEALEAREAARVAILDSLSLEVESLRRECSGGELDGDTPLDVDDDTADDILNLLSSPAGQKLVAAIKTPASRMIFETLVRQTLSTSTHASNGNRFDPLVIHIANSIRVHSPKAYDEMRKAGVPWPSVGVLNGATIPLQTHSGYCPERTAYFKQALKAAGVSLRTPLTIGIDGLALRSGIWYSTARRSVAGFAYVWSDDVLVRGSTDLPSEAAGPEEACGAEGGPEPGPYRGGFEGLQAKHAEVVIARDSSGRIACSLGFYPLDSETGSAISAIVLEVVAELTYAGLRPACIAWDGCSANRAAWRALTGAPAGDSSLPFRASSLVDGMPPGVAASADAIAGSVHCSFPNPAAPRLRVYIVFDPEHVLKRHRNALEGSRPDLADHKFFSWQFDDSTVRVSASWSHVKTAYHRDVSENGSNNATFLSWDAVDLTSANRLSVGLATRVVSGRLIAWLRELGQRPHVDVNTPYVASKASRPSSPRGSTGAGAAAATAGVGEAPFEAFQGNPFRATYTYLRTCRSIFDGTFQPVFLLSSNNPALREAWGSALSLAKQAGASKLEGLGFISHESVSDPLVTCASFFGIMHDYVEPLVRALGAAFPGLYGRALSSTMNERYYGEMRGGRSAGFVGGAMHAGDASRRDAILSTYTAAVGVVSAHNRGCRRSNVLREDDTGIDAIRATSDACTAGGTARSLTASADIIRPVWSAARELAAGERVFIIRSRYESVAISRDPQGPRVRVRVCSYRQGRESRVLRRRVQQEPVVVSLTRVQQRGLGEKSTASGYAPVPAVRAGRGTARLTSNEIYRRTLRAMLLAEPADRMRTGAQFMLPLGPAGASVSIDALPDAYATAHAGIVARLGTRGIASQQLSRPSLLAIRIFERLVTAGGPFLRIKAVVAARAGFVQSIEVALIADAELRRLVHLALAAAGCAPIDAVARTGPGSEDAAYELLALFVSAFVVGQWKHFRSGRVAHELSASGPSSKVALIAGLRNSVAASEKKTAKLAKKLKAAELSSVAVAAATASASAADLPGGAAQADVAMVGGDGARGGFPRGGARQGRGRVGGRLRNAEAQAKVDVRAAAGLPQAGAVRGGRGGRGPGRSGARRGGGVGRG